MDIPDDLPHQEWNERESSVGAISYLVVQTYEYAYDIATSELCTNETLHYMWARMHYFCPIDFFASWLQHQCSAKMATHSLLKTQIQVFNELWGKLQDVLKAVNAIVAARKKGRRKLGAAGTNADGMDGEWHSLWLYLAI